MEYNFWRDEFWRRSFLAFADSAQPIYIFCSTLKKISYEKIHKLLGYVTNIRYPQKELRLEKTLTAMKAWGKESEDTKIELAPPTNVRCSWSFARKMNVFKSIEGIFNICYKSMAGFPNIQDKLELPTTIHSPFYSCDNDNLVTHNRPLRSRLRRTGSLTSMQLLSWFFLAPTFVFGKLRYLFSQYRSMRLLWISARDLRFIRFKTAKLSTFVIIYTAKAWNVLRNIFLIWEICS